MLNALLCCFSPRLGLFTHLVLPHINGSSFQEIFLTCQITDPGPKSFILRIVHVTKHMFFSVHGTKHMLVWLALRLLTWILDLIGCLPQDDAAWPWKTLDETDSGPLNYMFLIIFLDIEQFSSNLRVSVAFSHALQIDYCSVVFCHFALSKYSFISSCYHVIYHFGIDWLTPPVICA